MNEQRIASPGRRSRSTFGVALAVLVAVGVACSSSGSGKVSHEGALRPDSGSELAASFPLGDPIPAPTGEPVLRIVGKIGAANGDEGLTLDRAMIEKLGVRPVDLYEPFEKQRMRFQAVPFAALLALAHVDASATKVHMVALDDYTADFSLGEVRDKSVFLATGTGDGTPIPVEKGGPVRLIFQDGSARAGNTESWIWSMATVEIK